MAVRSASSLRTYFLSFASISFQVISKSQLWDSQIFPHYSLPSCNKCKYQARSPSTQPCIFSPKKRIPISTHRARHTLPVCLPATNWKIAGCSNFISAILRAVLMVCTTIHKHPNRLLAQVYRRCSALKTQQNLPDKQSLAVRRSLQQQMVNSNKG